MPGSLFRSRFARVIIPEESSLRAGTNCARLTSLRYSKLKDIKPTIYSVAFRGGRAELFREAAAAAAAASRPFYGLLTDSICNYSFVYARFTCVYGPLAFMAPVVSGRPQAPLRITALRTDQDQHLTTHFRTWTLATRGNDGPPEKQMKKITFSAITTVLCLIFLLSLSNYSHTHNHKQTYIQFKLIFLSLSLDSFFFTRLA